ncbi:hypothetical protein BU24DRAFT_58569 [Aaosphaeria arxii CBS 175.79]|uniref:F-box domain-containing protein n=1 Tax=Aaosphaeria arxii CBS 175.79 TaxID=1450172 RepID=A0A6A5XBU0_9PLEO|nr:uncharacterized protein BU24DRAFT_58569 [Aaosphaeria arxii CBS 175.79]KAF2010442.1 hypothetical protein BU24DRAFT_58569 [Aaosphaeria arxii CBS 175.79]
MGIWNFLSRKQSVFVDDLPNEVLIQILSEVINDSSPTRTNVLTVCRLWHQLAVPEFYKHIAFTKHNKLESFLQCADVSRHGRHIRSLTIHMGDGGAKDLIFFKKEKLSTFVPPLTRLVSILPILSGLLSYSLCVTRDMDCVLPRHLLVQIINALPESCVNLEVDTLGRDSRTQSEQLHVCDSIRQILPRMKYVRVRMGAMCSSMFGTRKTLHATEDGPASNDGNGEFLPIETTSLRSLVVNCMDSSGGTLQKCGQEDWKEWEVYRGWGYPSPWTSVTFGMGQLLLKNSQYLQGTRIYAIDSPNSVSHVPHESGDHQTLIHADIVAKETWAIPYEMVLFRTCRHYLEYLSNPFIFRLPDGREMMASVDNMVKHAECAQWETTGNGSRLPRNAKGRYIDADSSKDFGLPIITPRQWQAEHPRKRQPTNYRERKFGMRLFGAEHRVGGDHLSLRIVKEIIPEGWTRERSGDLVKVD